MRLALSVLIGLLFLIGCGSKPASTGGLTPRPDLALTGIAASPSSPTVGDAVGIAVGIDNAGDADSQATSVKLEQLSGAAWVLVGSAAWPAMSWLAAEGTQSFVVDTTGMAPGTYYFKVTIVQDVAGGETKTSNNALVVAVTVVAPVAPVAPV